MQYVAAFYSILLRNSNDYFVFFFDVATGETTAAPSEKTTAVAPGKTTSNRERSRRDYSF